MYLVLGLLLTVAGTATNDLHQELEQAARTYDLPRADALATTLEANAAPEETMLRARAWLLVAELRRMNYEALPEDAADERRALGKQIDAAADTGLRAAEALDTSSEKSRIYADLIGTKIRSRYRAGKYKDALNRAVADAMDLDPANARALVSKAKTFVLRPDANSADLRAGQEVLEQALSLAPDLEQAHLLQAYSWERLGEPESARACYEQCLERNPSCAPASAGLLRLQEQS